jgi:hypothetical protein
MQNKENNAHMDEMCYGVAMTDFSDPELDQINSDLSAIYPNFEASLLWPDEYSNGN